MTFFEDSNQIEYRLIHELTRFDSAQVLDVGGGDGRLTAHFGARAARTLLLDLDVEELAQARETLSQAGVARFGLHQGAAERLPHPADSFDLVVFSWSL